MRNWILMFLMGLSVIAYSNNGIEKKSTDDRKVLNYEVRRDVQKNHIDVYITEETFTYKIIWGDTLSELAVKFGTTVKKLARDNKIKDIDLIYAGDDLIVEKRNNNQPEE